MEQKENWKINQMERCIIITIAGKHIKLSTIDAYLAHLQKEDVGDAYTYDEERSRLHNAIFLEAGFWDIGRCPARVVQKDSEFGEELASLISHVRTCPKGHGTTDRNSFCFKCGRFITLKDNLDMLRKIPGEQNGHAKTTLENIAK